MTATHPNDLTYLTELFDAIEFGFVIIDDKGAILSINHTLTTLFGYDAEQLIGRSANLFWSAFHQQNKYAQAFEALRLGNKWQGELLCKATDGSVFPVNTSWHPHPLNPAFAIGIFTDLTQQRRWESELLEAKERAERYLDISQAMILALDTEGTVLEINRRGCELLGASNTELLGKNWFEVAIPEAKRADEMDLFQLLINGADLGDSIESNIISSRGTIHHIAWHHSLTTDEKGTIIGVLSSGQDITQRKAAEQEIMRIAMTDSLTGLLNRRSFHQRFRESLHLAARNNLAVSIIAIDLDDFKPINDLHGHEMGDKVLMRVAELLRSNLRESDHIVRLGGDEFAVIAVGKRQPKVLDKSLNRLLTALREPMTVNGQTIQIGASIGVAQYPDNGADPDDLLRKADEALYKAKDSGRNRIVHY